MSAAWLISNRRLNLLTSIVRQVKKRFDWLHSKQALVVCKNFASQLELKLSEINEWLVAYRASTKMGGSLSFLQAHCRVKTSLNRGCQWKRSKIQYFQKATALHKDWWRKQGTSLHKVILYRRSNDDSPANLNYQTYRLKIYPEIIIDDYLGTYIVLTNDFPN